MRDRNIVVMVKAKTYEYLCKLGIPANLDGYKYIAYILQKYATEVVSGNITNLLDKVGKELGSSGFRVERAVRHVIEVSWTNIVDSSLSRQIENSTKGGKPTVSSYLTAVAYDYLNSVCDCDNV